MLLKQNKTAFLPGDSLIEVVVVAFILVVSLVALTSLTTVSIARNRLAKERIVATRLAQEGIEWLMLERNQLGFSSVEKTGTYCLNSFPENVTLLVPENSECTNSLNGLYKRTVVLEDKGDFVAITATVFWRDTQVKLTGQLSKWEK